MFYVLFLKRRKKKEKRLHGKCLVSKVEVGVKLVVSMFSMFSMFSMIFLLALVRGRRPPQEFVDAII